MFERRIMSARVLSLRRSGSRTVGRCVGSVMGSTARDVFYSIFSRILQFDALAIAVIRWVVGWWRRNLVCCLIG